MNSCPKCWNSYRNCKCGPDYPEFKPKRSREHFEQLMSELTNCKVGDGLLEVTNDHKYKNEHVAFLWQCYNYGVR